MNKQPPLPMTPLDMLVTTQDLQIIKFMLPYLPSSFRNILAIYLKFAEFQTALRLFRRTSFDPSGDPIQSKSIHSPIDLLTDLKPFLPPEDAEMFETILSALQMMNGFPESGQSNGSPDARQNTDYADMLNQFDSFLKGMEQNHERMDESSGNETNRSGQTGTDQDGRRTDKR